jgi:hypothetical protein
MHVLWGAAEVEEVAEPLEESGVDSHGGALEQVWHLLAQIPQAELCEPQVQIALVLAEAQELQGILQQARIWQRVAATGLPRERMDLLGPASEALRDAETRWIKALYPAPAHARALEDGQRLRDEMLSACRWNLRLRAVSSELARITDSTDPLELSMDLRELAEVVSDHLADFNADHSFRAAEAAGQSRDLARALAAVENAQLRADEASELRSRAFTYLADLMDEVRAAGRHAFRGTGDARRLFASDLAVRRRRVSRTSSLRLGAQRAG